MDHIFFTTSGRGIVSEPTRSDNSGLSLTALTPLDLAGVLPSPFLAGVPLFFFEAAFQSSSESSSELSARFLRPPALPALRPLPPFFPPPDFLPGLYSSSLPSSSYK